LQETIVLATEIIRLYRKQLNVWVLGKIAHLKDLLKAIHGTPCEAIVRCMEMEGLCCGKLCLSLIL